MLFSMFLAARERRRRANIGTLSERTPVFSRCAPAPAQAPAALPAAAAERDVVAEDEAAAAQPTKPMKHKRSSSAGDAKSPQRPNSVSSTRVSAPTAAES